MRWKAWYADGRVYSSEATSWEQLPREGLVVVTGERDGKRFIESGDDAIVLAGEAIVGVNLPLPELEEVAVRLAEAGVLKYGVLMPDADYEALWLRAHVDQRPEG